MKKFVLVSLCTRVKESSICEYQFHFIGVYCGIKIKGIIMKSNRCLDIIKGDEFVLYLECLGISNGVMDVKIIHSKKLRQLNLF